MKKPYLLCLAILFICLFGSKSVYAKTVLYVPLDDRPVNLDYVADTATAAGVKLLLPPRDLIGGRNTPGEPDKLWEWL